MEAVGAGLAPMRRRRLRPLVSEEQTGEGGRRGVPARGRFQIWPTFARAAWIGHEYVRRLSMHVQRHPHGSIILAAAASPIESESPLFGPLPQSPPTEAFPLAWMQAISWESGRDVCPQAVPHGCVLIDACCKLALLKPSNNPSSESLGRSESASPSRPSHRLTGHDRATPPHPLTTHQTLNS